MHPRASLQVSISYGCPAIGTTCNSEANLQPWLWHLKTIIIQHFSSLINTYTNHLIGTHSSHSIVKFMLYNPVNNKHYNACIKHLIIHWHVIPFVKVNERFLGLSELFWPKSIHKLTLSCTLGVISNTGP